MKNYNVELPKESIDYINKLNIKDVKIKENKILFKTDKKSLNILKNKFEYIYFANSLKVLLKNVLNNYIVTLFGCFIFLFVMFFISKSITEINFIDENTYNSEVYDYVNVSLKKVGYFRFLKKDINTIDKDLKRKFSNYEWIGISKKGTRLLIEISPSFLDDKYEDEKNYGSLYAKKDAVIKKYHVEKGILMIQEEQYVKRGDILISGNIIHYDETIEKIHPQGYVIGEVLEYYDYEIKKTVSYNVRNGKMTYKDYLYFKDKLIGHDKNSSEYEEVIVKNIFNLFYIKRRYYYEKSNVKTIYNLIEAENYAKTLIYKKFLLNKKNEDERIIYIKLVRYYEDTNNFYFRFVVKSEESIEEFLTN